MKNTNSGTTGETVHGDKAPKISDLLTGRKSLCESGWTGDRCTKRLGHKGAHSNEGR